MMRDIAETSQILIPLYKQFKNKGEYVATLCEKHALYLPPVVVRLSSSDGQVDSCKAE